MKFPNAYDGISKIFLAELLAIVAAICTVIGAILVLSGVGAESVGSEALGGGLAIGGGIFVLATAVLMVISFILNILGVSHASKDEEGFKSALIAIIVGIVAVVVSAIFSKNVTLATICSIVSKICEILVFWFCISGIINLAEKLRDNNVRNKAESLIKLIVGMYAIGIVLAIINAFVTFAPFIENVINVAAAVCSIIAYFMYLSLLSSAKKMLA